MKRNYSEVQAQPPQSQHTMEQPVFAARGGRGTARAQPVPDPAGKMKMCMQCGTTRTPQWREGPLGPKTLCNACGVKRVRALKAMQQGRAGSAHKKAQRQSAAAAAAAAARTESVDLAATLQMLAGRLDATGAAAPPPAKRQAVRATQSAGGSSGRSKRASSLLAAQQQQQEHPDAAQMDYEPVGTGFVGAAAGAGTSTLLPEAVQKVLAAMAKGSIGGESNPTDSGEEISWSPTDHEGAAAAGRDGGRPPLSAAAAARKQQRAAVVQLQRAAAAALQANAADAAGDVMQLLGQLGMQQQFQEEPQSTEAAAAAAAQAGSGRRRKEDVAAAELQADEADAAANLLSMSAAPEHAGTAAGAGAGTPMNKAVMRDLIAQLSGAAAALGGGGGRSKLHTQQQRHVVTVRQRAPAPLKEDDLLYLMGPGMPVLARNVGPQQMLEVVKLNEVLAEAQRGAAAADAAVAAVDKILREKRAAAEVATAAAIAAARQLHLYVSDLNTQHHLMQRAAQEAVAQAQAAAAFHQQQQQQRVVASKPSKASRLQQQPPLGVSEDIVTAAVGLGSSRAGSQQQLDMLAAMPHHQQQQQQQQQQQKVGILEFNPQQQGGTAGHGSGTPADTNTASVKVKPEPAAAAAGRADADDVMTMNAAVMPAEEETNAEDLEAAALLGSLHDLAAAAGGRPVGPIGMNDDGTMDI